MERKKYKFGQPILLPQDIEVHSEREKFKQPKVNLPILENLPLIPKIKMELARDVGIHMSTIIVDDALNESKLRTFCGIDNGVTGGITILSSDGTVIIHAVTPVKKCMNYTKKKAFVIRVNSIAFREMINLAGPNTFVMIERPMVNPTRFAATISAIRCLEATELILEELKIPYQFIDSKEWQKALLPSGLKGSDDLKIASNSVASRLYPRLKIVNSDCLLIALHCKNKMT